MHTLLFSSSNLQRKRFFFVACCSVFLFILSAKTAQSVFLSQSIIQSAPSIGPSSIDGGTDPKSATPTFTWTAVTGADTYTVHICKVPFSATGTCSSIEQNATGITGTSWTPTKELTRNVRVYWRVQGVSKVYGSGPWSQVANFVTSFAPPLPVLTAVPTAPQTTTPKLIWSTTVSSTAMPPYSYDVQICTLANCPTGSLILERNVPGTTETSTSSTILKRSWVVSPSLQTGTAYFWRVRSRGADGDTSGWQTATSTFKTQVGPVSLLYPTAGSDQTTTTPTFSWNQTPGAATYTVQISTNGGSTFTSLSPVVKEPTTSMTPTAALPKPASGQTQLFWRVLTTGVTGTGTAISEVRSFLPAFAPNVPVLTALSASVPQSTLTPKLLWTTAVPTGGIIPSTWDIQIAQDTAFSSLVLDMSSPGVQETGSTTTSYKRSYTVPTSILENGTQYYWRVRSKASSGDVSAWSTASPFKTAVAAAINQSPANGSRVESTTPLFSWSSVVGAKTYTVQISTNGGTSFTNLSPVVTAPTTSMTPTAALPKPASGQTQLFWRVLTTGNTGFGTSLSESSTITPALAPPVPVLTALSASVPQATLTPKVIWTTTIPTGGIIPTSWDIQVDTSSAFANPVFNTTTTGVDAGSSGNVYKKSTSLSGLSYGTQYYWRVRSKSASNDASAWSSASPFKTIVGTPVLSAPRDGTAVTTTTPDFTWGTAPGALSYTVQISTNGGSTYTNISPVVKAPYVSMRPSTALPKPATGQTKLYWRVLATGATGFGTATSSPFTLIPVTAPSVPVLNLPATNSQQTTLTPYLKWTTARPSGSLEPINWDLQIATTNTFAGTSIVADKVNVTATTETSTATSYVRSWNVSPTLSPATTYYWRVRSKSAAGNASAWSSVFSFKTPLTAPDTGTPTVTVSLSASPTTLTAGGSSTLTATVGGTATGTISYEYKCKATDSYVIGTGSTYSCSYTSAGSYQATVRVVREGVSAESSPVLIQVNTAPTVSISSLTPSPTSGTAPLTIGATVAVTGTATGSMDIEFDCTNDGTVDTFRNGITASPHTASSICTYSSAGTYTLSAAVIRQGVRSVAKTATVTVSVPPTPPPSTDKPQSTSFGTLSQGSATQPLVWKHTSAGNDNALLIVSVAYHASRSDQNKVKLVEYGPSGVDLTVVRRDRYHDYATELWYLKAPASGSNYDIRVSFDGTPNSIVATASIFNSIDQQYPIRPDIDGVIRGIGNGRADEPWPTNFSVSIPSHAEEIPFAVVSTYSGNANSLTPGSGQLEVKNALFENVNTSTSYASSGSTISTIQWNSSSAWPYSSSGFSIRRMTAPPYVFVSIDSLTANPNSGISQLTTKVTASVGGNATGLYTAQIDCTNDGTFERTISSLSASSFSVDNACSYSSVGTYTLALQITRQGVSSKKTTTVAVQDPNGPLLVPRSMPDEYPAPPSDAKKIKVLNVIYRKPGEDKPGWTQALNEAPIEWEKQFERASRELGYKDVNSKPVIDIVRLPTIVRRADALPNAGESWASLALMLSANNNEICNKINTEGIDLVWMGFTPDFANSPAGVWKDEYNKYLNYDYPLAATDNVCGQNTGTTRSFAVLAGPTKLIKTPDGVDHIQTDQDISLHVFGHYLEDLLPPILSEDVVLNRFAGVDYNRSTWAPIVVSPTGKIICGNVHYPPYSSSIQDAYEYGLTKSATGNSCEDWNPSLNGNAQTVTRFNWGCSDAACLDKWYEQWWMNNMPGKTRAIMYDGDGNGPKSPKRIPPWFEFIGNPSATIEYYVRRRYQWWVDMNWVKQNFPNMPLYPDYITSQSSTNTPDGSNLTFSHTSSGTNPLLLVTVGYGSNAGTSVSQIKYGSASLSLLRADRREGRSVEIWYLKNPATSGVVTVQFTGTINGSAAIAQTIQGVNLANPFVGTGVGDGTSTSSGGTANHTLTVPSEANTVVVGSYASYSGSNMVTTVGDTMDTDAQINNGIILFSMTRDGTANSTGLQWTNSTEWFWSASAVAIRKQ